MIKLLNTKDKRKILKAVRKKERFLTEQQTIDGLPARMEVRRLE